VALLRALPACQKARSTAKGDEKLGVDIVIRALRAPARQICKNAGLEGDVIVEQILEKTGRTGFDVTKGEFVDMFKSGIVDPAKVVRTALQNAASVASLMLTTDVMLTDVKDKDKRIAHAIR